MPLAGKSVGRQKTRRLIYTMTHIHVRQQAKCQTQASWPSPVPSAVLASAVWGVCGQIRPPHLGHMAFLCLSKPRVAVAYQHPHPEKNSPINVFLPQNYFLKFTPVKLSIPIPSSLFYFKSSLILKPPTYSFLPATSPPCSACPLPPSVPHLSRSQTIPWLGKCAHIRLYV